MLTCMCLCAYGCAWVKSVYEFPPISWAWTASVPLPLPTADASRDTNILRFNVDLENQVEALNKEVMDIRLSAQHEMILDDESSPEQVQLLQSKANCKLLDHAQIPGFYSVKLKWIV